MHALPALILFCLFVTAAWGQSDSPAAVFKPEAAPLDPAAYPLHNAPVNRDRVYDFYAKEARHALAQPVLPPTLPPYPGLDGGKYGHWGNQNEKTWEDGRWNQMEIGSLPVSWARRCV